MKRQRSILRSALLLVPVLATMGAVPRFAQAQSSGPADSVWVADDQTAQSNCTINGLPCAPGTVFYVHRVPLAAAQAAHKPYLAGTANSAEQDGFLESRRAQVRPAQTATVSPSIPGLSCTARPYTDAGQAYLNTIGSSVSESSTYYVDSWCNRFARSYSTSLVSGPLTYKNDTSDRPHLSWRTLAVYGRPFSPFLRALRLSPLHEYTITVPASHTFVHEPPALIQGEIARGHVIGVDITNIVDATTKAHSLYVFVDLRHHLAGIALDPATLPTLQGIMRAVRRYNALHTQHQNRIKIKWRFM